MRRVVVLGVVAGLAVTTGCGAKAPPKTAPASSPGPGPAAAALQMRAAAAGKLAFSGTYAVSSGAASVRVFVTPSAYRVDVVEKASLASLYGGTGKPTVACTVASGKTAICYTAAAAGASVPTAFDAGVQRVFTRDLPTLAQASADVGVTEERPPAAVLAIAPSTRCFVVAAAGTAPQTDGGTYCLDLTGLPVRLVFPSGTLTLASRGATPTTAQLTAPVVPRPLPPEVSTSPSPSTSGPAELPTTPPSGIVSGSPVR